MNPTWLCNIQGMNPDDVRAMLLPHETELKDNGITSLSVFGSVARGDASDLSDIDLLTDFDRNKELTAFDKAGLEVRISEILRAPVELCDRRLVKEAVRVRAEREAVVVF
jgi:predicted nucleotidyltransferase